MTQAIQSSFVCTTPGRYVAKATRVDGKTDLLSIYVNRVKKLWPAVETDAEVTGTLRLQTNDVVESTGTLFVEKIVE